MKLLVAMDLSDVTQPIMDAVIRVANANQAKAWLLHVAEPEPDFMGYDAGPEVVRDQVAREFRDEHRQIQRLAEELRHAGVDSKALLFQGSIVETILKQVERLEADLVVIGSHGHGAVFDLLVGSVCNGVLKQARVPVLVVPVQHQDRAD
jgi:nucleotide-binding universal stress UspA family protein